MTDDEDTSWMALAYCAGTAAAGLWWEDLPSYACGPGGAEKNERALAERIANAKAGCAQCLVRAECLEYALAGETDRLKDTIAGGLTTAERALLRPVSRYDTSGRRKADVAALEQEVDARTADPLGASSA